MTGLTRADSQLADAGQAAGRNASQTGGAAGAAYSLYVEQIEGSATASQLEQLHAQLASFFGKAPAGPLSIAVFRSRERFVQGLSADGQPVPTAAGGYYSPATKKAYCYVQPSDYFTRQLVLHEALHQFHFLVATGNHNPSVEWYTEGLAEYFGMHNWDGRTLKTGVVPAITLEDYPAAAMKAFRSANEDLDGLACGRIPCPRPLAWALVHFLINNHPTEFRELARRLDEGDDPGLAWTSVTASLGGADLKQKLMIWIESHQQPWQIVWVGWQQHGAAIEGASEVNAMAVLKATPAAITARLEPLKDGVKAGLAFGYVSPQQFCLFQVVGAEGYRIVRRADGRWTCLAQGRLPVSANRDGPVLSARIEGDLVRLAANGQEIKTIRAPGQVGLSVDGGRTLFDITLSDSPATPVAAPTDFKSSNNG